MNAPVRIRSYSDGPLLDHDIDALSLEAIDQQGKYPSSQTGVFEIRFDVLRALIEAYKENESLKRQIEQRDDEISALDDEISALNTEIHELEHALEVATGDAIDPDA